MSKKKHRKKQQFKYAQPTTASKNVQSPERTESLRPAVARPHHSAKAAPEAVGLGYVRADLIKVGVLATAFVAFEIALWVAFNYTGLGEAVYRVKL